MGVFLRCDGKPIETENALECDVRFGAITYDEGQMPDLLVCPQPKLFNPSGGTVNIRSLVSDAPALRRVHELFARNGLSDVLADDGVPLSVQTDPSLNSEAYRLEIGTERVELTFSDDMGAFYGGVTLATLMVNHDGEIPCGTIEDEPRFEWRGQQRDCA